MKNIRSNAPDIFQFEKRFREIVYEVQRNTKELDKLEKEHLLIREELCSKESLLQNERRISNELRHRLKLATETINRLQEEKMRDKLDYSNLSLNYDSILKERDILTKETLSSKTEAAKLKIKTESLENTLRRETRRKEELEKALVQLKNDNEKIVADIDTNIAKISNEQKHLIESSKAIIHLNKRLQTFGLCFHAINERNKKEIKNLQQKLIALSYKESIQLADSKLYPEVETLCYKLKEALTELKSKMQDSATFEENLNKIFKELSYKYNNDQYQIGEEK